MVEKDLEEEELSKQQILKRKLICHSRGLLALLFRILLNRRKVPA